MTKPRCYCGKHTLPAGKPIVTNGNRDTHGPDMCFEFSKGRFCARPEPQLVPVASGGVE